MEFEFDELLELEFDERFELEFDDLLELELDELLELEFDELLEFEFDELLPANCCNSSLEALPVPSNSGATVFGVRMMLLIPPVSTAAGVTEACEAPVAPVIAAKAKASMGPIL